MSSADIAAFRLVLPDATFSQAATAIQQANGNLEVALNRWLEHGPPAVAQPTRLISPVFTPNAGWFCRQKSKSHDHVCHAECT